MRSHVIEVGPCAVRRLCCGGDSFADDDEAERAALECIDDTFALVEFRPIDVASLWQSVVDSIHCGAVDAVTIVHPSWWSSTRVGVVTAAARAVADRAEVRPRSWLLSQSSGALIVEIAEEFVVITGAATDVCPRGQPDVAAAVVRSILTIEGAAEIVMIDAPATVRGAGALASAIARQLPGSCGMAVVVVDDLGFRKIAGELKSNTDWSRSAAVRRRLGPLVAVLCAVALVIGAGALRFPRHSRARPHFATTLAVEGHVVVEVPADWPMHRVTVGPGSARLQFTSPADPDVALHVTQSRVALPGLQATADFLKRAIDEAPSGVFVDFNPADSGAGRPAVTYREIRSSHVVRWTVWVDKAVRISVGCQSRIGRENTVEEVCELAVRSARALD